MKERNKEEAEFGRMVRRKTWHSFLLFFCFIILAVAGWKWLNSRADADGALWPLRNALNANAKIFSSVFRTNHPAHEYSKSDVVKNVRVNGDVGMGSDFDTAEWKLQVVRYSEYTSLPGDTFYVTLDEIKKMPKTEVIFNFKCIEGWSQVTWWGGVRFSDFAAYYKLGTKSGLAPDKNNPKDMVAYTGLSTPDEEYYVGIDMPAMMHPQTILCYEMNGKALPMDQGAPLRLIIPVKYGIKHLKRIGTIYFSQTPPPDYWAERGYDYYAGL